MIKLIIKLDCEWVGPGLSNMTIEVEGFKSDDATEAQLDFAERIRKFINDESASFGKERLASGIIQCNRDFPNTGEVLDPGWDKEGT